MGIEIERKFLVHGEAWKSAPGVQCALLRQGYLSSQPERTVRVRIENGSAWLTIKGKSVGATRSEWEYAIPQADAAEMLDRLCEPGLIEKLRYRVKVGGMLWEVDEFVGRNAGLVVAEIELAREDQQFERPDWLGQEVTGDTRYFNSSLVRRPYSDW